ncbi:hypothetical protein BWQ96_08952 [Gracilariopsis chorda]|uniref:Uncharacterized protein n=1 Tax=Gracilariopsis chorda TaxID=448386 RepID=A0A2V3IGY9_9FLOR|nr:hypothetical protein BWQ96_08952 [Gracilariopsis chorda]|eukprot:PXF41337.1 hypothetical protein BWQ96_08952 [Gracilariopsis chorda]
MATKPANAQKSTTIPPDEFQTKAHDFTFDIQEFTIKVRHIFSSKIGALVSVIYSKIPPPKGIEIGDRETVLNAPNREPNDKPNGTPKNVPTPNSAFFSYAQVVKNNISPRPSPEPSTLPLFEVDKINADTFFPSNKGRKQMQRATTGLLGRENKQLAILKTSDDFPPLKYSLNLTRVFATAGVREPITNWYGQ